MHEARCEIDDFQPKSPWAHWVCVRTLAKAPDRVRFPSSKMHGNKWKTKIVSLTDTNVFALCWIVPIATNWPSIQVRLFFWWTPNCFVHTQTHTHTQTCSIFFHVEKYFPSCRVQVRVRLCVPHLYRSMVVVVPFRCRSIIMTYTFICWTHSQSGNMYVS